MSDKTYKGKTRAEWIAARSENRDLDSRVRRFFQGSPAEIEGALLWFDEQDSKAQIGREDSRSRKTLMIAGLSAVFSAASLIVSIVALNKQPHIPLPVAQALSPASDSPLPQKTNSVSAIATQAPPAQHKP